MADIFDTLEEQPKTDIFDQIDVAAPSAGLPDLEAVDAMLSRQESMRKIVPGPSVTAGGPPSAVAPLSVAWQEPGEELTRPALRFSELVPPVRPDESVPSAAVKTLGRVALSVPEFFTSPLGITTAIAGPAAPKLTAGLFAADMLRGVPKEASAIGAQWDRMTPAQKTEAVISLGASALMGAGLGAKALGGIVPKAKIAAPEPPPLPEAEPEPLPPPEPVLLPMPPKPPPPIPKAIERVVEDYVEPEPTEVAVKAEELAAKPAEQPAAKLSKEDAFKELRLEGVTMEDAAALLAGEKTVKEVVQGNFKVTPAYVATPEGMPGPKGHDEAWILGYNQALERLGVILDRAGVKEPSEQPAAKAAEPEKGVTPDATEERKVEESVQRERERADAQRLQKVPSPRDSLQPEAQVGPEKAEVLLTPEHAESLEKSGVSREDIYKQTGLWKIPGGQWIREGPKISIDNATVKRIWDDARNPHSDPKRHSVFGYDLEELLGENHPLFEQHPKLRKMKVNVDLVAQSAGGGFSTPLTIDRTAEGWIKISIPVKPVYDKPTDSFSYKYITTKEHPEKAFGQGKYEIQTQDASEIISRVLQHEVEHSVQWKLDLPEGGSPLDYFFDNKLKFSEEEYGTKGRDYYKRLAGEALARLSERRMRMSDAERAQEPPWITFDKMLTEEGVLKPGQSVNDVLIVKRGGKVISRPPEPTPAEPAAGKGEGMPEGPGALTAGTSPTGKSQIEQLADAFKNKAPTRDRAAALVRQSFDYGARQAQAKDAVSRAVAGLKAAADKTWQLLSSFEKPDDLLKAKGALSAELETRGWRVRQFVKSVRQAMPDVKRRAAISKWIEAGGDVAELQRGEAATKPQFKQAYRDAQRLTPEEQIAAQNVSSYFESRLQEAIDEGILEHGLDDYIHRIYARDPVLQKKAFAYVQSGILSKNPSLAKKRMFQFDWEAERAGKLPVQDFVERVADYETSLSKAIAARKFIRQMTQLHAPDGRPVIGIKGVGIPIEDQQGVRTGTIIKPLGDFTKNAKAYAVEDANGQIVAYFDKLPSADAHAASIGGRAIDNPHYRGDYINREFNALSKWKWVGTDTDGKPIFLQGDVAIHPDFAGRIDALLKPSQIRYGSHPGLSAVGRVALGIGSTFKQTMLDLSGFHQVQIAVHGLEHRVWALPTGKAPPGFAKIIKDVDFEDPNVQGLLKGGVTLGGEYHASNYGEGLFGKALTQHVPVLGPVLESYHSWLFQDFIPRVKMTMALHALERNKARYRKELASGRMTEDDLNFLTAKQANAAFGELNYTMMERNKTLQDMARIIMLAPDFLEARAKFVAQAANWKYGKEQRVALLLGATTLWALARAGNMILDGQPHNEPENLFNIVYGNNAYSLRTVQGDVLHAATKPVQFWLNRLNPVYTRTLLELVAQRDQFGRKRDFWQVIGDTASNIVPISLRSSRERHLWESILNSIGVTAKRWNDVKRASDLAQEWKKASGVRSEPGEFIYDPDKDPVRGLKIALSEQDEGGAVKEIKRLLESKATTEQKLTEHFKRYANAHFAGTAANERKFMASLTDDQKKTVLAAYQHRKAMFQLYRRALSQYFATR